MRIWMSIVAVKWFLTNKKIEVDFSSATRNDERHTRSLGSFCRIPFSVLKTFELSFTCNYQKTSVNYAMSSENKCEHTIEEISDDRLTHNWNCTSVFMCLIYTTSTLFMRSIFKQFKVYLKISFQTNSRFNKTMKFIGIFWKIFCFSVKKGLIKDADKLKLMLLAWNYQNSNAGNTRRDNVQIFRHKLIHFSMNFRSSQWNRSTRFGNG